MMPSPVAGIDPHQDSFTVGIVNVNGVELSHETFPNTAAGYVAALELLAAHGVKRVGIEGSASWGAHVAITTVAAGFDAHEVPPQRSAAQRRARRLDKTDIIDSLSTARALLAEPTLGPVQTLEIYEPLVAKIEAVLEHRRMLVEVRTLVLHYAQDQISKLPTEIRDQLTATGKDRVAPASPRPARHRDPVDDGRRLPVVVTDPAHRPRPPGPPPDPPTRTRP